MTPGSPPFVAGNAARRLSMQADADKEDINLHTLFALPGEPLQRPAHQGKRHAPSAHTGTRRTVPAGKPGGRSHSDRRRFGRGDCGPSGEHHRHSDVLAADKVQREHEVRTAGSRRHRARGGIRRAGDSREPFQPCRQPHARAARRRLLPVRTNSSRRAYWTTRTT